MENPARNERGSLTAQSLRKADGVTRKRARKARVKVSWLSHPVSRAMSSIVARDVKSSHAPRSSRSRRWCAPGVSPTTCTVSRWNCRREKQAARAMTSTARGPSAGFSPRRRRTAMLSSQRIAGVLSIVAIVKEPGLRRLDVSCHSSHPLRRAASLLCPKFRRRNGFANHPQT